MNSRNSIFRTLALLAVVALLPIAAAAAPQPIEYEVGSTHIEFYPMTDYFSAHVAVDGLDCVNVQLRFKRGERIVFVPAEYELPDGRYTINVTLRPDKAARPGWAVGGGDPQLCRGRAELPPMDVLTLTIYQSVLNGKFVDPRQEEEGQLVSPAGEVNGGGPQSMAAPGLVNASSDGPTPMSAADQVILDDLIVDGSLCVGFDCVNGEVFSFDTIRLKENNLRIKFDDTSVVPSFPANDWQLTANESANGGASKFSIEDISGGRTVFTVEANAPSHSLYVDDGGRLGLGTSTPTVDIHVKDGDTPTLRLEQDTSSGFAAQTWDVAGNETNFFIRDATNGSTLPLRIRPGADSNALFIDVDSDVGIGTSSPDSSLHVRRTDGTAMVHVEEANGSAMGRTLMELENNGQLTFALSRSDGAQPNTWSFTHNGDQFNFTKAGTGANEFAVFDNGDVEARGTITGSIANPSSKALKTDFADLDPQTILAKVAGLPVVQWRYKARDEGIVHMGPMAEDFFNTFGVGSDDRIFLADVNGVALAAIQGLHEQAEDKDARLAQLEEEKGELEERVAELEKLVRQLAQ